jgi:signal transduction histidine kinase
LGLAIVDDLARLYDGSVALKDSPAGGLRAVLTLPAATLSAD